MRTHTVLVMMNLDYLIGTESERSGTRRDRDGERRVELLGAVMVLAELLGAVMMLAYALVGPDPCVRIRCW